MSPAPRPEGPGRQLALQLPVQPDYRREALVLTPSHDAALRLIDGWPHWPGPCAVVSGPEGSGKTHLLHIWAARADAMLAAGRDLTTEAVLAQPHGARLAIDDADQAAGTADGARALFHAINRAQQEGGHILLTGVTHPQHWETPLADLKTRLGATTTADIEPPDDALLAAILAKLFADRQLTAGPALISFLVARMERTYGAASALVSAMDQATLGTGKTLSFDLADRLIAGLTRD